jgi:aminoglycoside 3-N-acetyltransferase
MDNVTREQIAEGIRALGVAPGEMLLAHSSLKSLGHVEGGAETVVNALIQSIGPGGAAFVPVFNYDVHAFDVSTTPSVVGAVTEAFRRFPHAVRSLHPTHSVAGIGPAAHEILEGHDSVHPFGKGSPLWKLWERDAWVLLIGVDHRASSMIHVAEEFVAIPYINRTRVAQVVRNGKIEKVTVRRPGCDFAFNRIDPILRKRGRIFERRVGNARLALMRSTDIVEAAAVLMRENPAALLCSLPDDGVCDEARRLIKERIEHRATETQRNKSR